MLISHPFLNQIFVPDLMQILFGPAKVNRDLIAASAFIFGVQGLVDIADKVDDEFQCVALFSGL